MLPKPERGVEQTEEDDQQQRPTEQTGQDVDPDERHGGERTGAQSCEVRPVQRGRRERPGR